MGRGLSGKAHPAKSEESEGGGGEGRGEGRGGEGIKMIISKLPRLTGCTPLSPLIIPAICGAATIVMQRRGE